MRKKKNITAVSTNIKPLIELPEIELGELFSDNAESELEKDKKENINMEEKIIAEVVEEEIDQIENDIDYDDDYIDDETPLDDDDDMSEEAVENEGKESEEGAFNFEGFDFDPTYYYYYGGGYYSDSDYATDDL